MSNCFDPDRDLHSIGPDLGPNCLQRLIFINPIHAGYFFMILLSYLLIFFFKINFFKTFFQEHYQIAKGLDPYQDRITFGPDLGPNCLQRLSADNNSHHKQEFCISFCFSKIDLVILKFHM